MWFSRERAKTYISMNNSNFLCYLLACIFLNLNEFLFVKSNQKKSKSILRYTVPSVRFGTGLFGAHSDLRNCCLMGRHQFQQLDGLHSVGDWLRSKSRLIDLFPFILHSLHDIQDELSRRQLLHSSLASFLLAILLYRLGEALLKRQRN